MVSDTTTLTLNDCGNVVSDVAFSPDGKRFCVASWDTMLRVYDIGEGAYRVHGVSPLADEHSGCVSCCSYNADSTLLVSGGYDATLCIWDARHHGATQFRLQPHESAWITACAFSASGEWIVSGSRKGEIRHFRLSDLRRTPAYRARLRERGKVFVCSACKQPFSIFADDDDTMRLNAAEQEQQQEKLCVFCRYTPNMQAIDVEQRFEALMSGTFNSNSVYEENDIDKGRTFKHEVPAEKQEKKSSS